MLEEQNKIVGMGKTKYMRALGHVGGTKQNRMGTDDSASVPHVPPAKKLDPTLRTLLLGAHDPQCVLFQCRRVPGVFKRVVFFLKLFWQVSFLPSFTPFFSFFPFSLSFISSLLALLLFSSFIFFLCFLPVRPSFISFLYALPFPFARLFPSLAFFLVILPFYPSFIFFFFILLLFSSFVSFFYFRPFYPSFTVISFFISLLRVFSLRLSFTLSFTCFIRVFLLLPSFTPFICSLYSYIPFR